MTNKETVTPEEALLLTPELITERHKERVAKVLVDHDLGSTQELWKVPDELHALQLANAEDYRTLVGRTKPNSKALNLSAEEESNDIPEAENAESGEDSGNGV